MERISISQANFQTLRKLPEGAEVTIANARGGAMTFTKTDEDMLGLQECYNDLSRRYEWCCEENTKLEEDNFKLRITSAGFILLSLGMVAASICKLFV